MGEHLPGQMDIHECIQVAETNADGWEPTHELDHLDAQERPVFRPTNQRAMTAQEVVAERLKEKDDGRTSQGQPDQA